MLNSQLILVNDDPCVTAKKTPKRHFEDEHAVLEFFLLVFEPACHLKIFVVADFP